MKLIFCMIPTPFRASSRLLTTLSQRNPRPFCNSIVINWINELALVQGPLNELVSVRRSLSGSITDMNINHIVALVNGGNSSIGNLCVASSFSNQSAGYHTSPPLFCKVEEVNCSFMFTSSTLQNSGGLV